MLVVAVVVALSAAQNCAVVNGTRSWCMCHSPSLRLSSSTSATNGCPPTAAADYGCYIDTVIPRTLPHKASGTPKSWVECAQSCTTDGFTGTAGEAKRLAR